MSNSKPLPINVVLLGCFALVFNILMVVFAVLQFIPYFVILLTFFFTVVVTYELYRWTVHQQEVSMQMEESTFDLITANRSLEDIKTAASSIFEDLATNKTRIEQDSARDRAILSSIGDGTIVTDTSGKIIMINKRCEVMLGFKADEIVGKSWSEVFSVQDNTGIHIPTEERAIFKAIRNGETINESSHYFVRKDKTRFPTAVTAAPIILDEKIVGAIEVIRDITSQKEVDAMKTEIISLASHQLRTPLSSIRWFLEMLLNGEAGELTKEQHEFISNINDSNQRMIELINALLNISRIESGRIIIEPKLTFLGDLVKQILNDLKVKISIKKITVDLNIDDKLPKINIDPKLISQVYMNLLTNAIKYTPSGGKITVSLSLDGDQIISTITDTGYGIPEREQSRVYEKFYRGSNVIKVETDGTGLGLYLVKAILDASRGRIWFVSKENEGTSFSFSLPLQGMQAKSGEVSLDTSV